MNYFKNNKQFKAGDLIKNSGFTMIELIITIALSAIILAIAVPSFQTVIEKNRIASETDRLFTTIKQARNNAIVTGSFSYICRTDNTVNLSAGPFICSTTVNGQTGDWSGNFLVYTEIPGLDIPDPNNSYGNVLINTLSASAGQIDQMLQGASSAPFNGIRINADIDQAALRFEPDGSLSNGGPVRFAVCDPRLPVPEMNGRIIEINAIGAARTFSTNTTDANRSCTP